MREQLLDIYQRLFEHFGPQDWWPGETPFEVCVGAILTQNTSWQNVKKAIDNLKQAELLSVQGLFQMEEAMLANLIRPAGYYNIKAARLKAFINFLMHEFRGDLDAMFQTPLEEIRQQLLSIRGIGPETADSILLYAGGLPTFVVDAYTMRTLSRHGLIFEDATYEDVRGMFMDNLPADVQLYNEFHALLVALGKHYCKKTRPLCSSCPLFTG
jgi:endonuclease-3 related protein